MQKSKIIDDLIKVVTDVRYIYYGFNRATFCQNDKNHKQEKTKQKSELQRSQRIGLGDKVKDHDFIVYFLMLNDNCRLKFLRSYEVSLLI